MMNHLNLSNAKMDEELNKKKFKDFDIPEEKKQEVINEWNKTLAWVEDQLKNQSC